MVSVYDILDGLRSSALCRETLFRRWTATGGPRRVDLAMRDDVLQDPHDTLYELLQVVSSGLTSYSRKARDLVNQLIGSSRRLNCQHPPGFLVTRCE